MRNGTIEMSHGTVCPKCLLWPDLCPCRPTTARQLHRAIGKTGHVNVGAAGGQFTLLVGVVDVRRVYGRLDYLVTPMDDESTGEAWIEAARFRPE